MSDRRTNINTRAYWDERFGSGSWESNRGRQQTADFARGQIPYLRIAPEFDGTLLDFGCGLGDAMPVYRQHFPRARLLGMDLSAAAIDLCRQRFGHIASFSQGDHTVVEPAEVIISSNVFEHLSDDRQVAASLLTACRLLEIIVPYREYPPAYLPPAGAEHVNTHYDEQSFDALGVSGWNIFPCRGWSEYGFKRWYHITMLNLARRAVRLPLRPRKLQIIYHLPGRF